MATPQKRQKADAFKSGFIRDACFSSLHEFPVLKCTTYKPTKVVPFDKAARTTNFDQWLHFYIDDHRFECVWRNPKQYLNLLKRFAGVITPDFSLYQDLPLVMQMWNTYRNRAIAHWLQSNGVKIIPNVRWGDERTYAFAFEGLEQGGTVAVSTHGCIRNKLDRYYFKKGLAKMLEVLQPSTVVNYSYAPADILGIYAEKGVEVIQIDNHLATVRKEGKA